MFSARVKSSRDIKRFLKEHGAEIEREIVEPEMKWLAKSTHDYIAKRWRIHKKSGELEFSIDHEVTKDHKGLNVFVFSTADYAPYIEWGTRPHPIDPIDPVNVLRFYSRDAMKYVFAKHVEHPGTTADPAFREAAIRYFYGFYGRLLNKIKEKYR